MPLFYVEELGAAFVIFTVLFVFVIAVSLIVFVLDRASQMVLGWCIVCATTLARAAFRLVQRILCDVAYLCPSYHHREAGRTMWASAVRKRRAE